MAHPIMYDEDDPVLARVRAIALAFPQAAEKVPHGRPAFYSVKVFGYYGGSIKVDGTYVRHEQSLLVLPEPGEYEALAQDERVYRPAYLGPFGWLGVDLTIDMDWTEVAELVDASYRMTAPRRLVAELDARR
jgi:predicted DNA-binding protein (MmcQ/YjbR family)